MKKYYCKDCHKKTSTKCTIRCSSCHIKYLWTLGCYKHRPKGNKHHNWSGGVNSCMDCGKKLTDYISKRCRKCFSLFLKKIRIGKKNPAYKTGFYSRNKKCIDCKRHCSSGAIRCKSCSEHRNKLGRKNPQYVHGKGHLPYTKDFPQIRIIILQRDNYICKLCNKKGNTVHHIDYNKKNNKFNNLITTCKKCNTKVNSNRDYWYAYFICLINTILKRK